jgi:hypothetical protein
MGSSGYNTEDEDPAKTNASLFCNASTIAAAHSPRGNIFRYAIRHEIPSRSNAQQQPSVYVCQYTLVFETGRE